MALQAVPFKDANGQWRFRIVAENGEPIGSSEGYHNKKDMEHTAMRIGRENFDLVWPGEPTPSRSQTEPIEAESQQENIKIQDNRFEKSDDPSSEDQEDDEIGGGND